MNSSVNVPRVELAGDWKVSVSVKTSAGKEIKATVDIVAPVAVKVQHEKYDKLPDFNTKAWGGWQKGVPLKGVLSQECTTCFALDPATLKVSPGTGTDAVMYEKGKDYEAELGWGSVGRLHEGKIKAEQPVFISYEYYPQRIDAIILSSKNKIIVKQGKPHIANPKPPALAPGETRLSNIYMPCKIMKLGGENLYPVLETEYPEPPKKSPTVAERFLPKAMKKLNEGGKLKVLAWGDSVTDGSFLSNKDTERWQEQFVSRLRIRFPKAEIELVTEAWGGRNTSVYLAEPPGSIHNYQEKVLNAKPDIIVMEFVNDAGLSKEIFKPQYDRLLKDITGIGAEWIILTPHYIRPDWMGLTRQYDIDDDPREYVKFLREFTAENKIPLADASLRYGRLWRQGIPYNSLMKNNINHPDARGMKIFADSLMALFP
jgi:lysophospholipase L1-like esterase